jgi:hypothetical protein
MRRSGLGIREHLLEMRDYALLLDQAAGDITRVTWVFGAHLSR